MIAVASEAQWKAFCSVLECPEFVSDVRFATGKDRSNNREVLSKCILEILATRPAGEWIEAINARGIPCGPVLNYLQALNSDQSQALNLTSQMYRADGSGLRIMRGPISIDHQPTLVRSAPPALGEHSREILDSMGLNAEQIEVLIAEGIIREPKILIESGAAR